MNKSFLISGNGGQGVLSIGAILANIFLLLGKEVCATSSYGAEMRGGAVNCEIYISDKEIYCAQNQFVDCVVVFNQESFNKFISRVKQGGVLVVNSSLVQVDKSRNDISYIFAPFTQVAVDLGNIKIANSVALGVILKMFPEISIDIVQEAYGKVLSNKTELIEKNIKACNFGYNFSKEVDDD